MIFKTTRWLGMCLALVFASFYSANAQSNCGTPTSVTALPYSSGSVTSCGAGDDFAAGFSCANSSYGGGEDYVFSFIAPATENYLIEFSGYSWTNVSVHTACPPTSANCVGGTANSATSKSYTLSATSGTTYTIVIDSWPTPTCGSFTLDVSVAPPPATAPANDDCGGAIALTVNADQACGSVTSGTVEAATASPEDPAACSGTENDDVWYSFTATNSTHRISLLNVTGSTTDMYHSLWEGTCGALTSTGLCSDGNTSNPTGLTVGATYFVRVNTWGSTAGATSVFDICIGTPPPPPANDLCAGALPATVGANGTCPLGVGENSVDFSAATDSGVYPSCDGFGNYDLWYTWVATSVSIEFTDGASDPGLAVYSGTCGALVEIGCINNASGTIGGLTIGETYYLQVWDDTQGISTVEWCWQAGPACGDPTGLAATNMTQTTADITFNPLAAGGHTVEYGAPTFTPGSGTTVLVPTGGSVTITGLTSLTSYDVYVTAVCGTTPVGPVNFTTTGPPPANDDCGGAVSLTVNPDYACGSVTSGSLANATASSEDPSICFGTENDDVWFSFVATATSHRITLTNVTGTPSDLFHALWEGTCGSLTHAGLCSDGNTSNPSGLTIGSTYLVRVNSYSSSAGASTAFDICIGTPPPPPVNDEIAGAIPVPCDAVISGTTIGATQGADESTTCVTSVSAPGVWYTVVGTGFDVTIDICGATHDSKMNVYTGGAGNLTCVTGEDDDFTICGGNDPSITFQADDGITYYILVQGYSNGTGTFNLTVACDEPVIAAAAGCAGTVTATVDGSGTPAVVHFIDGSGDLYASIANTQNLGSVAVSLYGGTGPRQTGAGDYYLDRNVAIVPTTQPSAAMSVTIYVLDTEVTAMINASGDVATVNDLQFAKVSGTATCSTTFPGGAVPVGIAATPYGTDWAFTASVSSFSEFFALPSAAPLPVELSSFNAYATTSGNRVEWTAATELDLYMYTVERAIDPASFSAFADVAPTGTEYAEAVYTSQDLNPATTTYYRLRMEDLDGTVEYSDVVAVTRDDVKGGIHMFPNPANDKVTFELAPSISTGANVNVVLTDLNGRVIREWSLAAGQRTEVNVSDIASGVYMVSTVSATSTESQRLVID